MPGAPAGNWELPSVRRNWLARLGFSLMHDVEGRHLVGLGESGEVEDISLAELKAGLDL